MQWISLQNDLSWWYYCLIQLLSKNQKKNSILCFNHYGLEEWERRKRWEVEEEGVLQLSSASQAWSGKDWIGGSRCLRGKAMPPPLLCYYLHYSTSSRFFQKLGPCLPLLLFSSSHGRIFPFQFVHFAFCNISFFHWMNACYRDVVKSQQFCSLGFMV